MSCFIFCLAVLEKCTENGWPPVTLYIYRVRNSSPSPDKIWFNVRIKILIHFPIKSKCQDNFQMLLRALHIHVHIIYIIIIAGSVYMYSTSLSLAAMERQRARRVEPPMESKMSTWLECTLMSRPFTCQLQCNAHTNVRSSKAKQTYVTLL